MKQLVVQDPFFGFLPFEDNSLFRGFSSKNFLKIDMEETDKDIIVMVDLPGFSEKNINVKVEDHKLIVSGSHEEEKEEKQKKYFYKERSSNSVYREIHLPKEVDQDNVKAKLKDGVMTVTLPKKIKPKKEVRVEKE